MSGVYALVWDDREKESKAEECLLRKTPGGWSHITVAYYGSAIAPDNLRQLMRRATDTLVGQKITIDSFKPNVFQCKGRTRYDVLLTLSQDSTKLIEDLRLTMPEPKFKHQVPHITWKVSWDKATHERDLERIANLLKTPVEVTITGLTID